VSVIRFGVHPAVLNPFVCSKIIKQVCYPKALYGCELQGTLMEQTVYVHYITVHRVLLFVFPHCRSLLLVTENVKLHFALYCSQISTMIWDDWRLIVIIEMASAYTGEFAIKSCKRAPCLESSSSLIRSFTNIKYSLADKTLPCQSPRCSVKRHFCVTHWWKQYFLHFCWNLSLCIFTIWKSIVYNLFCRDGIYFDKILVSEYKLFKRSDCTKTFDTVPHDGIRIKLREYGTTSKLWLLLYYMYTNPLCGGRLSEWLTLHRGDWQGSVLLAKLYFIFSKVFVQSDLLKSLYSDTKILSKYIPSLQKRL
jgi:hypothetical protein